LLITGGLDPTTRPRQQEAFRRDAAAPALIEFRQAGHFTHADDPARYADAVIGFVRESG
jgi:pimeloyl-ACP methyl ester carboxylesterase